MVAAVVDTGIDARHRDLDEGKVLKFVNCLSGRCYARSPFDNNGHGTHVAATLAGEGDARADRLHRGVAPAGALVGVKVLGSDGTATKSTVVAGLDWTVANRSRYGIEAVNISLGGGGCSDGTDVMSRAANRAAANGLLAVAAAGNSGPARCTISAPAAGARVVAVGAMVDVAHGGFLASWISGRGIPGGRIQPDVMAPGEKVVSARSGTVRGYGAKTGTSMAAPFVTGVGLLMRDARPARRRPSEGSCVPPRSTGDSAEPGPTPARADPTWTSVGGSSTPTARSPPPRGLTNPRTPPAHRVLEGDFSATERLRDFPIEVTDRSRPLAASLITRWNGYNGAYDFDVELLDPSGRVVARGDSTERQDDVYALAFDHRDVHREGARLQRRRKLFRRRLRGSVDRRVSRALSSRRGFRIPQAPRAPAALRPSPRPPPRARRWPRAGRRRTRRGRASRPSRHSVRSTGGRCSS
jgi:serine protease AprX